MKLAIVYPWQSPFVFTQFVDSIANLQKPEGCEVRFFRGKGWGPARRHVSGCEQALAWDAELICIIGADQTYSEDMLVRLKSRWDEGYEVVSALVPCRGFVGWQKMNPFQPMAWRFKHNQPGEYQKYNGMADSSDMMELVTRDAGGMQKINFIGSGVLMFHRDHLLSLKKPWFFETIYTEDQQRVASMDCKFVWRLQDEAYAKVWVDTTIEVKHLHIFEIDDSFSDRFSDWSNPGIGDPDVCNHDPRTESAKETRGKPTPGTTGCHSEEPGLVADEVLQAV